jgi:4-cresol dehydrogenase (hydroxylating)
MLETEAKGQVALLRQWAELLGDAAVIGPALETTLPLPDIGEFYRRRVVALLRPRTQAQVHAIVAAATESGGAVPLYPVSTGRNWGLGSRQPAADDCALLDLGGLDRVRELNLERGFAVIEPGVTQGTLSRLLEGAPFMLNVTGACADTSVLGNALERGVGYLRQRTEDLLALEVILAGGTQIRVGGFWDAPIPGPAARAFHYRHGIGPDLLPLFCQSNLGVVTAGVVALVPRPECVRVFQATVPAPALDRALEVLRTLHRDGLLNAVSRVWNAAALPPSPAAPGPGAEDSFLFAGAFLGRRPVADTVAKIVLDELRRDGLAPGALAFDAEAADRVPGAIRSLAETFAGRAAACPGIQQSFGTQSCALDHASAEGWRLFLSAVPFAPAAVRRALDLSGVIARAEGVRRNLNLNLLGSTCVDLAMSLRFPRTAEGIRRAQAALDRLHGTFRAEGFFPFRADIDHQGADDLYGPGPYQDTLRQLKRALDPAGLFSPGRYLPSLPPADSLHNWVK